jgi:pilus assembly protein CpaB
MRLVSLLIVVGALVVAVAIFLVVPRFMRGSQQAQQQAQPQVVQLAAQSVLVAARPLPAGTVLKLEDVRFQKWPQDAIDPAYLVQEKGADPQKVAVGLIVLHGIDVGEPITAARLLKPGDTSFLSAALTPGLRAVTIKVDPASAEAGFILPEDHVDVVLAEHYQLQSDSNEGKTSRPLFTTKEVASIILRNIKVLAINQSIQDIDSKPNAAVATATLEVDLLQAQKIEVASSLGNISLILRSHTLPARPEPEGQSPTVEDFQASPYRAAVIQQYYSAVANAEDQASGGGGLRVYHGTRLAGTQQ